MENHIGRLVLNRFEQYSDKEMLRIFEKNAWRGITGQKAAEISRKIALALLHEGVQEQDRIGIFSQNMPEWTLTDVASSLVNAVPVPVFATQIAHEVKYILKDAGIKILFVGEKEQYGEILKIIDDADLQLQKVIVFDNSVELKHANSVHFDEWIQADNSSYEAQLDYILKEAVSDSLATIIYTSGTTGEPKGVMLNHSNIIETLRNHDLKFDISSEDVSLAFLPLAHVFERAWTYYVLHKGCTNVYSKDPKTVAQVMVKAQPTLMCSVPRLFEKVYFTVESTMKKSSGIKQKLFAAAVKAGKEVDKMKIAGKNIPAGLKLKHAVLDKLVLSKIREKMGGKLRFMPCGGAALSPEITTFFRAVGIPVIIGYGLTETTATVTCFDVDDYVPGGAGKTLPNVEVKIGENDEILVKGANVMKGYYKKPEETSRVFDEEGWFRTGDAGYIDADGNLFITDRIKDLIKTSGGKYVAPQLVESVLLNHQLIEQAAVVGEGKPYVSALLTPNFEVLTAWAKNKGLDFQNVTELIAQPTVVAMYKDLVNSLQSQLSQFERVKKFRLLPREFSLEEDEMTPTFKIKRKVIYQKYASLIDEMY